MTTTTGPYLGRHRQNPDPDPETTQAPEPGSPAPEGTSPADQEAWTARAGTAAETRQPTSGGPPPGDPGPIRGSTLERMSRKGLEAAAEQAFRGAGEALNEVVADPADPADDVWIVSDDEADGVAEPTGRILARRLPEVPGGDANDAADLIALLIPLGIWALRGVAGTLRRVVARRRNTVPGQVIAPETEDAQ
jgi:hypothetical protein